jgi:hypothetical protein
MSWREKNRPPGYGRFWSKRGYWMNFYFRGQKTAFIQFHCARRRRVHNIRRSYDREFSRPKRSPPRFIIDSDFWWWRHTDRCWKSYRDAQYKPVVVNQQETLQWAGESEIDQMSSGSRSKSTPAISEATFGLNQASGAAGRKIAADGFGA